MNGDFSPVPLIGLQEAREAAQAQAMARGMYVTLVPQLAVMRLARGYEIEGGLVEAATPERIAEEAKEIVNVAMRMIASGK